MEKIFFLASLSHLRKESDPDPLVRGTDPDPHQNVTDPQHWYRYRVMISPGPEKLPGPICGQAVSKNSGMVQQSLVSFLINS
jgi:hypothetical protein